MKKIFEGLVYITAVVMFFMYTSEITDGMLSAVLRCINVIIPSLFFMMVISDYLIRTDILYCFRILFKPVGLVLGLDSSVVPVVILSNIGGFPVGIRLLSSLYEEKFITKKQAQVMYSFCFSSGPAFAIGTVGVCLMKSKAIGTYIFLSILIANLISCAVLSRIYKLGSIKIQRLKTSGKCSISDSVESASKALSSVCCVIVFFSGIIAMTEKIITSFSAFDNESVRTLFLSLLDITYITELPQAGFRIVPVIVFLLSMGGICVYLQNKRISRFKLGVIRVCAARAAVSLLAAVIYIVIFSSNCKEIMAISSQNVRLIVNIDNFIPSICLIIMIFLLFYKKRLAFQEKV